MIIRKVKLGDLYSVHNGLSKGRQFFGSGCPFLTFSDVFNHWFLPDELSSLVQSTEKEQEACSIQRGDVFITRTSETMDELGMSSVALKDYPHATYNGFTKRLRPLTNEVVPEYIGYYLRSPKFRGKFMAFSSMTTRASLANDDLLKMEIDLPDIKAQNDIAALLMRYDLLIDNYQKQIKLLEEAAQRLYKEWFVDLRFPGHENVKVVDGVPEGWNQCVLGDMAIDSGIRESKDNRDKYDYYVPIDCLPKKSLVYSDVENITLAESSLVSFVDGDILFGAMRPYFHKVCVAMGHGLTRSTCFVLNAKKRNLWSFLLLLLFEDSSIQYATKISVGTTMPYVRWKDFQSMKIVVPSDDIAALFDKEVRPIVSGLKTLSKQIPLLVEARDRLLPKLMNGEIEV